MQAFSYHSLHSLTSPSFRLALPFRLKLLFSLDLSFPWRLRVLARGSSLPPAAYGPLPTPLPFFSYPASETPA